MLHQFNFLDLFHKLSLGQPACRMIWELSLSVNIPCGLLVVPHPEMRHWVPGSGQLVVKFRTLTLSFKVAGISSLTSIISLFKVCRLYSGCTMAFDDNLSCSDQSMRLRWCSPRRTGKMLEERDKISFCCWKIALWQNCHFFPSLDGSAFVSLKASQQVDPEKPEVFLTRTFIYFASWFLKKNQINKLKLSFVHIGLLWKWRSHKIGGRL